MTTDPTKHIAHPSFPRVPKASSRKYAPSTDLEKIRKASNALVESLTYPMRTLRAPSGVTRIAGANAYAAKFAASPTTTSVRVSREICQATVSTYS